MTQDKYIEIVIPCSEDQKEILIAALDAAGYDSVLETEEGINGYILKKHFDETILQNLKDDYSLKDDIYWKEQEQQNWNEEWEKNFHPIVVEDLCYVRAPFHPSQDSYKYELIIQPKMSFGTGHHATTYLMIKNQINMIDHQQKIVLDAGCGTAILAVMAEKLGAKEIIAYDIDEWSIENAPENIELNGCENISVLKGTINSLRLDKLFDIILANINKNVLLEEIMHYANHLKNDGFLLLSGFYEEDIEDLIQEAKDSGLVKINSESKDRWACLLFKKL